MIRSALRSVAHSQAVSRALRSVYGGRGTILCLHRILPADRLSTLAANRALELTPEHLDEILGWARQAGYRFVSLATLVNELASPAAWGRMLAVTFDDGYVDNLIHGLPVLERHQAPATIFVITDAIDRTVDSWWYAAEELLAHEPDRDARFLAVRADILSGHAGKPSGLAGAIERANASLWLTWDEVRALAAHPLVTIGAHTVTHRPLAALDRDEARFELAESKRRLEGEIGDEVAFLAYPFGQPAQCGPREFALAQEVGFRAAVTTLDGNIRDGHRDRLHALPRHWVGEADYAPGAFARQISGYDRLMRLKGPGR